MAPAPVDAYLARYSDPRAAQYAAEITGRFSAALVIPLFDEPADALQTLLTHHPHVAHGPASRVLVIAVVNAPVSADTGQRQRTLELLQQLRRQDRDNHLIIDCVSTGRQLPDRKTVGLARKIGTDVALHLFASGQLQRPWIYQSDADAILPADYFDTPLPPGASAVVFGHHHVSARPLLQQAARLYELHMQHYRQGLAAAGSRYAFPTLGSTIVVDAMSYAKVRGYPQRDAAEDFYLLNKLAKVGAVHFLPQTVVTLQARLSRRVPFGTGPSLQRICEGLQADPSGLFYHSYHPHSFQLLGRANTFLSALAQDPATTACVRSNQLLQELGLHKVCQNIQRQYARPHHQLAAFEDWFDAKRTLRFIHLARRFFPDQPLLQNLPPGVSLADLTLPRDPAHK